MRISRHQCFMQVAEVVARRSTCFRRNVGAVITVDHRIVSVGYNGSASGEAHCTGAGCAGPNGCTRAIHAEVNAINHVPKGAGGRHWRMYVTESPCPSCADELEQSPCSEVYFLNQYRLTEGNAKLVAANIRLFRMTPAGHIVDWATNELIEDEK